MKNIFKRNKKNTNNKQDKKKALEKSNPVKNKKPKTSKKNKTTDSSKKESLQTLSKGLTSIEDIIAPSSIEVDFTYLKIGQTYLRTLFVAGYPRFVTANWLSPLINYNHTMDISIYIYPSQGKGILDDLRKKIGEMEAEIQTDIQKGKVINIETQVKLEDARALQKELAKGAERFFQMGLYITVSADNLSELNKTTKQIQTTLGSLMIVSKVATLQMEDAFKTTLPTCTDKLQITRNMDTTSLACTFPFTSSELTENKGVMYGINEHNDSLIIFDRFSLENANMVVLSKSGAGKSFAVKLEVLRSILFGTEVLVIDPENEYEKLCKTIGGEYIRFEPNTPIKINPFDLSLTQKEGENELGMKILSLHTLLKIIMGNVSAQQEAVLDQALILTYRQKGITNDPQTHKNTPPLMEDLYKVLVGMETPEAKSLAARLERFIKGSLKGIFNQQTSIDLNSPFIVFSTKELEDKLRPIAIFIILDYIWTRIKRDLKKRLLVVDEAWYLMKNKDSASFLYGIAKRARKYYLGLTTITQDVEDFLNNDYGKAIITNSSIQFLMKQSPAAIDTLAEVFYLSQGEKNLLLSCDVGHGLFFAGNNHVACNVVASSEEYNLITSDPKDLVKEKKE